MYQSEASSFCPPHDVPVVVGGGPADGVPERRPGGTACWDVDHCDQNTDWFSWTGGAGTGTFLRDDLVRLNGAEEPLAEDWWRTSYLESAGAVLQLNAGS